MPKIEDGIYKYTSSYTRGSTVYYRCSYYRGTNCTARLVVKDGVITKRIGEHSCQSAQEPLQRNDSPVVAQTVERYCQDGTLSASQVYHRVVQDLRLSSQGTPMRLPSKQTVRESLLN